MRIRALALVLVSWLLASPAAGGGAFYIKNTGDTTLYVARLQWTMMLFDPRFTYEGWFLVEPGQTRQLLGGHGRVYGHFGFAQFDSDGNFGRVDFKPSSRWRRSPQRSEWVLPVRSKSWKLTATGKTKSELGKQREGWDMMQMSYYITVAERSRYTLELNPKLSTPVRSFSWHRNLKKPADKKKNEAVQQPRAMQYLLYHDVVLRPTDAVPVIRSDLTIADFRREFVRQNKVAVANTALLKFNAAGTDEDARLDALRHFKLAADLNDAPSMNMYGVLVHTGYGMKPNQDHAMVYLERAADGGHKLARLNIARIEASGSSIPPDQIKKNQAEFESLAPLHSSAFTDIVKARFSDDQLIRDRSLGLRLMNQAADAGNVTALKFLRDAYRDPHPGFSKDLSKASEYERRLRALGTSK